MSDYLTRAFRTQLTTAMDSVLRTAVFEITQIFEDSLHDHQVELAQKGEEIAQLKIKLQKAEIRLRECEGGGGGRVEVNKNQKDAVQIVSKRTLNAPGQASAVPEIDFEVPDDWCAPLGSESVTKQEDCCPSIRLRKLTIPLWHIPVIKQEVANCDVGQRRTRAGRKSRKVSSLNETHTKTRNRSVPQGDQNKQRPPVRNDMKHLLKDLKLEYSDLSADLGHRRMRKTSTGKEEENAKTSKRGGRTIPKTDSVSTEDEKTAKNSNEKTYSCKFCSKVFDTEFGLRVHVRFHKRCKGCKKNFPFPSALRQHKTSCPKFKKLMAAKSANPVPPTPETCNEEKPPRSPVSTRKLMIINKERTASCREHAASSIQEDKSTKFVCSYCNRRFYKSCRLEEHMSVHTVEWPFPCNMCTRKFRVSQALKVHLKRSHNGQKGSVEANTDISWTKPLEEVEDNQENVISSSKKTNHVTKNSVRREHSRPTRRSVKWQTMASKCPEGFVCLRCKKVVKNERHLIEHFRIHTGDKPVKCDACPATFSHRAYLYVHRKKHHCSTVFTCPTCGKTFTKEAMYKVHLQHFHQNWPNICKVCGKGFVTEGRLKNHMKHRHS